MKRLNGFSSKKLKEKVSIGIIGIEPGCGVTHLAIALANYMQSGLGRKAALLELSGKHELKDMIQKEGDKNKNLLGVHYFTDICVGKIPEIMNSKYEVFILDLGADYAMAREEFLRCDYKIVSGSISPWKISIYEHFLNNVIVAENYESWEFLVLFANISDKKNVQKRCGVRLMNIPWIENPFYLKKEDLMFLQKIV